MPSISRPCEDWDGNSCSDGISIFFSSKPVSYHLAPYPFFLMFAANHRRLLVLLAPFFLAVAFCVVPRSLLAASGAGVPKGAWEVRLVTKANTQFLRGPITYVFAINLKEGGEGTLTASLEYTGTPITDGLFKGAKHVKATVARPITSTTRNGDKLFVYNGGTFKLVSGDPPGHTIKEYATAGGLFPEATIDKMMTSFYGVIVYMIDGENLVLVPKEKGGKNIVWKKVE
jgi:hypothetical protein